MKLTRAERRRERRRPKGKLSRVIVYGRAPGAPGWRGTASVFRQFITPFMEKRGLSAGSKKRFRLIPGSSTASDHWYLNLTAFAIDYPTYSGEDEARALAAAFGVDSWRANSYAGHTVKVDGRRFRLQILWGAGIGHGDHVHVGLKAL